MSALMAREFQARNALFSPIGYLAPSGISITSACACHTRNANANANANALVQ